MVSRSFAGYIKVKFQMRFYTYFIALAVAAVSVVANLAAMAGYWVGINLVAAPFFTVFQWFSHPLPAQLQYLLPRVISAILDWSFTALVLRRLWLLGRHRNFSPPSSFTPWPYRLILVAVASLTLMVVGLILSFAIRAGSGVPAALFGLPAVFLLTPVLFYIELRSLPWFSTLKEKSPPWAPTSPGKNEI
jgi:hypothetical protein